MPMLYKLIAAAIAAGAFLLLGRAYLHQRDATAQAAADLIAMQNERDGARNLASACSDATEALRAQAAQRAEDAKKARDAAAIAARTRETRADYILGLKPSKPDACASLQALGDEWLAGRAKP